MRHAPLSRLPLLPLVGAVSAGVLAGCTPDSDDATVRLCRDAQGRRVADANCNSGGRGFGYAYVGAGRAVPAEGQQIRDYRNSPGAGEVRSADGRVLRGGLGGSARGSIAS